MSEAPPASSGAAEESQAEARLAFALDAAEVAAWDWDVASGALWCSAGLEALYGVVVADRGRAWDSFAAAIHPEDREPTRAAVFGALSGRSAERWRLDHRVATADGGWRWVHSRGRAAFDAQGRAVRLSGVCWDASERKRMEAALRASEQRFREAAEAACDWIWETDREHRFTYVLDRFGVIDAPAEWFFGKSVEEVMTGTVDAARLSAHLDDLAAHRPFRDFVYWIRRSGGWRCCSISGRPVFEAGEFLGYRGSGVDVTEQRRAEERLELALAGSEGFLWDMRYDPDGDSFTPIEVYVDPGAKAILGYADEELPSAVDAWHQRVLPEDLPRLHEAIRGYFAGRRPTYEVEYRVRRRDGSIRWISSRGRLARDPDGRPIRMSGVLWDATERKAAEERQDRLMAELDHRVKNALSRVQSILSQSLRSASSMEEFARGFEGRLAATARAHNLLTRESWLGADLRELARQELEPHAEGGNVRIDGEPVRLSPGAAVAFAMAFHELTTNAVKYGALSRPGGKVDVSWRRGDGRLRLEWTETGGPLAAEPSRRGFGSHLIERGLAYDLGGEARLEFRPEGLRCLVEAPLEDVA